MTNHPIALSRLAETSYVRFAGPEHITRTPFGRFARDPRCPTEWCFFGAECASGEADALLKTANEGWPIDQTERYITGHDPLTRSYLASRLTEEAGWRLFDMPLMVYERTPELEINAAIRIEAVDAATDERYHDIGGRWATPTVHEHRRLQDARLGGEGLIAWLGNEPVGYGGWYETDGLARFRRLGTLADFRRQRVCTTIVRYVQEHPVVKSHEALVIGSGGEYRTEMYRRCGFVERGKTWAFSLSAR